MAGHGSTRISQRRTSATQPGGRGLSTRTTSGHAGGPKLTTAATRLEVAAPGELLRLQHLAGNRRVSRLIGELGISAGANGSALATGRRHSVRRSDTGRAGPGLEAHGSGSMTIQRKLPTDKSLAGLVVNMGEATLGERIKEFNKREKKLSMVDRISALGTISRYIYHWYAQQNTKDLASLDSPVAKGIRKLEESISKQHESAVEKLLKTAPKGSKVPQLLDPTQEEGRKEPSAQEKALQILQLIASGNGPIKIAGGAAFKKKAHSMLYRIMESPAGMRLLEAIAAKGGTKRSVTIGEGEPPNELRGHLADPSPNESKATPQVSKVGEKERPDERETLATTLTNMTKLTADPENEDDFGAVAAPGDIHAAVMGGKRGIKVMEGTAQKFYEFAEGAPGVYVAIVNKKLGETADNVNMAGNSLYTPEFVTLGHELGHALSILAGSATITCEQIFSLFAGDVGTFENPTDTRNTWSNAEEFATINYVENQLRQDLGIQLRGGHYAVLDQNLEDRLQGMKSLTRQAEGLIYAVSAAPTIKSRTGDVAKLDALRKTMNDVSGLPLKGLSPTQKRGRCADYATGLKTGLKKLASMNKQVRVAATVELNGTMASFKQDLLRDAPEAVPSAFR